MAIPSGVRGMAFGLLRWQYSILVALPILVVGNTAISFLDRVKVVGSRNNRYCPSCRYDLSGTLAAGIMTCPECGRVVSVEHVPTEPPTP
jgi:hypothetical protein